MQHLPRVGMGRAKHDDGRLLVGVAIQPGLQTCSQRVTGGGVIKDGHRAPQQRFRQRMQVVRPGAEVAAGITLVPAHGHSPAHTAIRFSSGNAQLIHMADVAHRSDSGLQHPDWSVIFDFDGDQAIATRKRILGQVASDQTLVMGYHFPFPGLGYVEAAGSAYRWNAIPWSWS